MGSRPAVILAAALAVTACKKPPPPTDADGGAAPRDHLAEHEFPEGRESAFGLVLPLDSEVVYRVEKAVEVRSRLKPEELSNYVRTHVRDAKIVAGAQRTTFDDAVPNADGKKRLSIEISPSSRGTARSSMSVRDMTPGPVAPKVSDEDAYRKLGRTKDGKPLDPKNLF